MSKALICLWRQTSETVAQAATNYQTMGVTEAEADQRAEHPVRDAGTFRNLRTRVTANTLTGSATFTLQKSQVDTSVGVSYATTETGDKTDTSNSSSFAATDEARIEITAAAGGTSILYSLCAIEFAADTNGVSLITCKSASSSNLNVAETTNYFNPIGGRGTATTTEADREYRIQEAASWENMLTSVGTCARTTDVIANSRLNSAGNGNQTVTMTGGDDSVSYEDVSNSDALSAGDDIDWAVTTGTGTGNWNLEHISSNLINTSNRFYIGVHGLHERINGSLTRFWPVGGSMVSGEEATEANVSIASPFAFTSSDLTVGVKASTSGVPVYTTRKNGAGAQSVSYTSGETGIKTDASNTDSIAIDDVIAYQVTSNAGTNFDTQYIGTIGTIAAAASLPHLGLLLGVGI